MASWRGLNVCVCVSKYVSSRSPLSVCMYVFMAAQQVGLAGITCVYMHVCVTETGRGRVGGQARERLHSEEEFCSADDYTCRADATPAAGALAAKVTEPGWHREGLRGTGRVCVCVSLCEVMLEW